MFQSTQVSPDTVGDTARILRAYTEPVPLGVAQAFGGGRVTVPAWLAVASLLAAVATGAVITWAALRTRGRRSE